MKKYLSMLAAALLASLMLSCATTGGKAKATLTECQERMFWRIDGTDKKGSPSTVYVQGSFHLGDGRMYPLADSVLAAWNGADRLVAEISSKDTAQIQLKVMEMMVDSFKKAGGRLATDGLTEKQRATLGRYMEADVAAKLAVFEPWLTTYSIAAAIYQGNGLSAEYGLDNNLMAYASEAGREIEGLDTLQLQLDVITYGSYDEQMDMLRDVLDELDDPTEVIEMTRSLYEAYLANDKATFAKRSDEEKEADEARHAFYKAYNKMIYDDRNKDWAKDITGYLREGGTTFIFAGTAHWTGEGSVFDCLRKMGTIE